MVRILITEFILLALIGAIAFRLAWAFSKREKVVWGTIVVIGFLVLLVPARLDRSLIQEYGGAPPIPTHLSSVMDLFDHLLGLLSGALAASFIVAKRVKAGLDHGSRFRDFP